MCVFLQGEGGGYVGGAGLVSHVPFMRVLVGWPGWAATPPPLRSPSLVPAYRTFVSYIDLVPYMCVCEVQLDPLVVF